MILQRLTLEGFGSFQERQEIAFNSSLVYILGENQDQKTLANSNGSGKTTVLDAISWALYGECPSGRRKEAVIYHESDRARVLLQTSTLTIERSMRRGHGESVRYHAADGVWEAGDFTPTQARLQQAIGLSFQAFCNSLYLTRSSKTLRFLESKPAERAKVLAELVDDSVFQLAAKRADEEISRLSQELTIAENTRAAGERTVARDRQDLQNLRAQMVEIRDHQLEKSKALTEQLQQLRARSAELKEKINTEEPESFEELERDQIALRKELSDYSKASRRLEDALGLSLVATPGESCPLCKRALSAHDIQNLSVETAAQEEELWHIREQMKTIEEALRGNERRQQALRVFRQDVNQWQNELHQIDREMRILRDQLAPVNTKNLEAMIREKEEGIAAWETHFEELEQKAAKQRALLPLLRDLKKGFQQEIRNLLFDQVRSALDYYCGRYLYVLAGSNFSIEFPPLSSTGAEKFEVILRSGETVQDLSCFSEGECWRATFACLLGFRRMLLDSTGRAFGFLLVDDPVGALDDRGTDAFNRLLGELSDPENPEIPHIIATVPRQTTIPDHAEVLTIRKVGGKSSLEA